MKKIINVIQALHPPILLGTLFFLFFSCFLARLSTSIFSWIFFGIGVVGCLLFYFDAFNRFFEFRRTIKEISLRRKTDGVILNANKKTWCTREATKAAFKLVCKKRYLKAKKHYRDMGFKYYNFFPKGTFTKNSPWLKLKFYKNTFLSFLNKSEKTQN